jgi:hypothetical protein
VDRSDDALKKSIGERGGNRGYFEMFTPMSTVPFRGHKNSLLSIKIQDSQPSERFSFLLFLENT